jgi:hypothetical protein
MSSRTRKPIKRWAIVKKMGPERKKKSAGKRFGEEEG